MSYIINNEIMEDGCWATGSELRELKDEYQGILPEDSFLSDVDEYGDEEEVSLDLCWNGYGSGESFNTLIKEIFPQLHGTTKVRYNWDDGQFTIVCLDDSEIIEFVTNASNEYDGY